jgi:hypothetical protein
MTTPPTFQSSFGAFRQRILRLFTERMICWGVACAAGVGVMLVGADLLTIWYVTPEGLAALALAGGIGGALVARWRRPGDPAIARTIERAAPLQDRVSMAVEVPAQAVEPELGALITEDAAAHLGALSPETLFPRRVTRPLTLALAGWGLVAVLCLVPELVGRLSPEKRQERAAERRAGETLQLVAHKLSTGPTAAKDPQRRVAVRKLKKLGAEMVRHRLPRKEAMKRLNAVRAELAKAQEALPQELSEPERRQLAQELGALLKNRPAAETAAAQQAREALAAGKPITELSQAARDALAREGHLQRATEASAGGNLPQAARELSAAGVSAEELSAFAQTHLSAAELQAAQSGLEATLQQMNGEAAACPTCGDPTGACAQAGQCQGGQSQANAGNSGQTGQPSGAGGQGHQPGAGTQPGNQAGGQSGTPGSGQHTAQGTTPGTGGPEGEGPGAGHMGDAHARVPATLRRERTASAMDRGRSLVIMGNGPRGEGMTTTSAVPYYEVYLEYQKRAEHAFADERIPADDRQRVKAYFDALNP